MVMARRSNTVWYNMKTQWLDYLAFWTALEKKSKNFEVNPSVCEQHPPVTAWIILATKTLLMSCDDLRYSLKYIVNNSKNSEEKSIS